MDIGIGLPTTIAGTTGEQVVEWARRAERAGFSSLGTIDRLVYDNYEPLIALAGAAGATERIRLVTSVLLAPLRSNAALLAKQAASLQKLSNGRLVLGMAVGGREDDFEASGVPMNERGKRLDAALPEMRAIPGPRGGRGGASPPMASSFRLPGARRCARMPSAKLVIGGAAATTAIGVRVARSLYARWRDLPRADRERIEPMAEDLKQQALAVRGAPDRAQADAELFAANETFAAALVETAEGDPQLDDVEVHELREDLRRELERLANADIKAWRSRREAKPPHG